MQTLDDSFYLNCPGLVGEITREICEHAEQPYPSFAFAVACTAIGALKGCYLRDAWRNLPPSLYFMCFAPTGSGKQFPQTYMVNALNKMKLTRFLTQKVRSAPALFNELVRVGGVRILMLDEAHRMLASITTSRNEYKTEIKTLLLELYTAHGMGYYHPGNLVNVETEPTLKPSVSYCGFGVPVAIEEAFTPEAVMDGLLLRFFVLEDERPIVTLSNKDLSSIEPKFTESVEFVALLEKVEQYSQWRLNQQVGDFELEIIDFSPKAKDFLLEKDAEIVKHRNSSTENRLLWSRAFEQIIRLAVCVAGERIEYEHVRFASVFVEASIRNVQKRVGDLLESRSSRLADQIIEYIKIRLIDDGKSTTLREIVRRFRVSVKEAREYLLLLEESGYIAREEIEGEHRGRPSVKYWPEVASLTEEEKKIIAGLNNS